LVSFCFKSLDIEVIAPVVGVAFTERVSSVSTSYSKASRKTSLSFAAFLSASFATANSLIILVLLSFKEQPLLASSSFKLFSLSLSLLSFQILPFLYLIWLLVSFRFKTSDTDIVVSFVSVLFNKEISSASATKSSRNVSIAFTTFLSWAAAAAASALVIFVSLLVREQTLLPSSVINLSSSLFSWFE